MLKALWFSGGGILATWLAVSPNDGMPASPQPAAAQRQAASSEQVELSEQTIRLRERKSAADPGPSRRNPFRFSAPKPTAGTRGALPPPPAMAPIVPATPPPPALQLSGVARTSGNRTAIIAGNGQIYLVGEGDSVAGRYTVVKVDPEAVLLRDSAGAEHRLVLPQ
jgi:hypothetical protein